MEQNRENMKNEEERSIRRLATSYRWMSWCKIWCYGEGQLHACWLIQDASVRFSFVQLENILSLVCLKLIINHALKIPPMLKKTFFGWNPGLAIICADVSLVLHDFLRLTLLPLSLPDPFSFNVVEASVYIF